MWERGGVKNPIFGGDILFCMAPYVFGEMMLVFFSEWENNAVMSSCLL